MKLGKERELIIAIPTLKEFDKFLNTDFEYCVFLDMHISVLKSAIKTAHEKNKKVFLHMDLIHGLTNDIFGCEYAVQFLKADGVISTKPKVVAKGKDLGIVSILRLFLIDTHSLKKGLKTCEEVSPDYVELLPALACDILPRLKAKHDQNYMCGGLISTKEDVKKCFDRGALAVTISKLDIAIEYMKEFTEE